MTEGGPPQQILTLVKVFLLAGWDRAYWFDITRTDQLTRRRYLVMAWWGGYSTKLELTDGHMPRPMMRALVEDIRRASKDIRDQAQRANLSH